MSQPEEAVPAPERSLDRLRQFGRLALGAGAGLAATGVAVAPLAVMFALSTAQVETNVAQFTAEVSFSDQVSSFAVGPARAYVPRAQDTIGVQAHIEDAPPNISDIISPQNLKLLVGQSSGLSRDVQGTEERLKDDAVQKGQNFLLIGSLSLWGLGYAGYRAGGVHKLSPKKKLLIGGGMFMGATLATSGMALYWHQEWAQNQPHPRYTKIPLSGVERSPVAGAFVDTQFSKAAFEEAIPRVKTLWSGIQAENRTFLEHMSISWATQQGNVIGPQSNQYMLYAYGDMHGNDDSVKFMTTNLETLRSRPPKGSLRYVVVAGDRTEGIKTTQEYDNEKAQMTSIKQDDAHIISVDGNHDVLPHSPFKPAANKTVKVGNLKVLAVNDTQRQPWGGEAYLEHNVSEAELGAKIRTEAEKTKPDLVVVHEPDAVASFIGLQSDMVDFMQQHSGQTINASELGLKDIPAGIIIFGHDHIEVDPVTIINRDGTRSSLVNVGTAGGKVGGSEGKVNYFSLPVAPPLQVASELGLRVNSITNRLDGWQRYRLDPSAETEALPPMDVSITPGPAFKTNNTKAGIKLKKQRADAQARLAKQR